MKPESPFFMYDIVCKFILNNYSARVYLGGGGVGGSKEPPSLLNKKKI